VAGGHHRGHKGNPEPPPARRARGGLDDGLVFDAVRLRLIEIGEAVKRINPALLEGEPGVAWQDVAGMRDRLAHHYFDTSHAIVLATVDHDLPVLLAVGAPPSKQGGLISKTSR
jgi:hypothetical protein